MFAAVQSGWDVAAIGTIDQYISLVRSYPILSKEQEIDLATRFHNNHDIEAARMLVLSHLRFVVSTAREYLGYGLPFSDLIQEGTVGLMKAVRRFDPSRNVRLVSFCVYWIRADIQEFILKNWKLVKIATTKTRRKLFFNLRKLKKSIGLMSADEVGQIANKLGVKESEVVDMDSCMNADTSLDSEDDIHSVLDHVEADCTSDPVALLECREDNNVLKNALSVLDDRSRYVVQARWLDDEPLTLQNIAESLNVSAERVRQIEKMALRKMKTVLQASQ